MLGHFPSIDELLFRLLFRRIDELLFRLRGVTLFNKLDLRYKYCHISIAEHDQYKTAFACRYSNFSISYVIWAEKCPAHFLQIINKILKNMLDMCILVYMDNILIFSKSQGEHEFHVRQGFEQLQQCNFHIERNKYELFH